MNIISGALVFVVLMVGVGLPLWMSGLPWLTSVAYGFGLFCLSCLWHLGDKIVNRPEIPGRDDSQPDLRIV